MYFFIEIIFWLSIFIVLLTWGGYYLILLILSKLLKNTPNKYNGEDSVMRPFISIIIAARNEEKNIENRIKNLLTQDYPSDKFEIIVASDGSTDNTVNCLKKFNDYRIKILDFKERRGRALVHNDALLYAKGDLIVFTDAETRFSNSFLSKIKTPFQNPTVGASVGRLIYRNSSDNSITEAASKYWDYETKLRSLESDLGILTFGSGACTALRKELYYPLYPNEDIDYAQTLNIIKQGFKIAFVADAVAYDVITNSLSKTFINRVRQTSRAFRSIISRLFTWDIIKRPHIFLSVLFHKTFRHLTPFLLLFILISNIFLLSSNKFYQITFAVQCIFYIVGGFSLILYNNPELPRPFIYLSNFLLLNTGRFVGVIKSLYGHIYSKY